MNDEDIKKKATDWVCENSYKKGELNMTSQMFCQWVNTQLLMNCNLPPGFPRSISPRTAIHWLHALGFRSSQHRKGTFVDGHEREDVICSRDLYVKRIKTLEGMHQARPPCPDGTRP